MRQRVPAPFRIRVRPSDFPSFRGHTNLDFFDTIPIEDLMKNAVVMAIFVYNAAMSDEKIPRKGTGGGK